MYKAWIILLFTLYAAQSFLLLQNKLRLLVLHSASTLGGPQPIIWEQDIKGSVMTLPVSTVGQSCGISGLEKSKQCYFDHSDPCLASRGGRCHVDGRPCVAQRSYLPPRKFKNPKDIQIEKEHSYKDTIMTSARLDALHDDSLSRAERAQLSDKNRGRAQKEHEKLLYRSVEQVGGEARAFVEEPEVGNSYLITDSGVVIVDWHRIKSDLMPVITKDILGNVMKVIAMVTERIKHLMLHAFSVP